MQKELVAEFVRFVVAEELNQNSRTHKLRLDEMLKALGDEERRDVVNRLSLVKTYITGLMRG